MNSYSQMTLTLIVFLLWSGNAVAQNKSLGIKNKETGKQIYVKEKRRIRLKTTGGEKLSGRFWIVNTDTILIRKKAVAIADIIKIKRHPLLMNIVVNSYMYFFAAAGVSGAILGTLFTGQYEILLVIIPSVFLAWAAGESPNPIPAFKKEKWNFEII